MKCSGEESEIGGAVAEDGEADCRLIRDVFLIQTEKKDASGAKDEWDESPPASPGIHDSSPGERDEEGGCGRDEKELTNPIHAL